MSLPRVVATTIAILLALSLGNLSLLPAGRLGEQRQQPATQIPTDTPEPTDTLQPSLTQPLVTATLQPTVTSVVPLTPTSPPSNAISGLQEYVSLVKDIITVLSASTAAVIAILGLRTWRKQLKGKTEYELARRLLKATYKVRGAIDIVRAPFVSSGEVAQALEEAEIEVENPLHPDAQPQIQGAVYQRRWKRVQEAWTELEVEAFEAEVIWGQGIQDKIRQLQRSVTTLGSNITLYLYQLQHPIRGAPAENLESERAVRQEVLKIVYQVDEPEQDTFNAGLQASIRQIEDYLRPYLKL